MSRSSELFLYASEDPSDNSKKFSVECKNADVTLTCASDVKFAMAMKIKDGAAYFDVKDRIAAAESAASARTTAVDASISGLQTADATEQNARISADTVLTNAVAAETAARVAGVQGVQDALDIQEAKQVVDHAAALAATAAEESARIAGVAAEAAARASAVTALQGQISALLSNTDNTALNSLQEIVTAYVAGDTTLAAQASGMLTRLTAIEGILNEAFDSGL